MDKFRNMSVGKVYPLYAKKVERKGQSREDLDTIMRWLNGFTQAQLERKVGDCVTFEEFFSSATLNPNADQITGLISAQNCRRRR